MHTVAALTRCSRPSAWLCLALAASSVMACKRRVVVDLEVHVRAQPYPRARCGMGPAVAAPVLGRGRPIPQARLQLDPGRRRATTDSSGRALFPGTSADAQSIAIRAPGFRPRVIQPQIAQRGARPLQVHLQPCFYPGANRTEVGFDQRVTLHARNLCGPSWRGAKLRWTQLEGPDISASLSGRTSRTLTFTTAPLKKTRQLPSRPQLLSFSPDEAGQYVFRLEATASDGLRSEGYVLVTAASVTSGLTSVAPNHTYYFVGLPDGPWRWRITDAPRSWRIRLAGERSRTPALRIAERGPVKIGNESVELREDNSGFTFSLMIAGWNMTPRDCGRSACHATLEQNWKGSRHGTSWKMLVDGVHPLKRGDAGELCATCHSLGYDADVNDGGYDDIARATHVDFPAHPRPGTYDALPAAVKAVSNVYCLACHGPARLDPPFALQPGLFAVGICASCHGRLPEQDNVAQWRASAHAKDPARLKHNPAERASCARCHTAQAFYQSEFAMARPPSTGLALTTCCEHPQPVVCQACHNAMRSIFPRQLQTYAIATLPNGLELTNLGAAAVCVHCHNTGHDNHAPSTIEQRLAPHAPQTELLYGLGGFGPNRPKDADTQATSPTCASKTPQSCVTCHMRQAGRPPDRPELAFGGHTLRMRSEDKKREHLAACRDCHEGIKQLNMRAKADYDGDGKREGVQDETDGLLAQLEQRLKAAIVAKGYRGCAASRPRATWIATSELGQIVLVDRNKRDLGDCDANGHVEREEHPFLVPANATRLYKAAYNYLLVKKDRSRGLHNVPYTIGLLRHTIHQTRGHAP